MAKNEFCELCGGCSDIPNTFQSKCLKLAEAFSQAPMDNELKELVKSIKNRCLIFEAICDLPHLENTFPTILEDMYVDAQTIIDEYCEVKDE